MMFLSPAVGLVLACVASSLARALPQGKLQNVTLHNTNPRIEYLPDTTCVPGWVYGCSRRFNPWELREYQDPSGLNRTAHFVSSERNYAKGEGLREIVFSVQASGVYIYGAPRNQLQHPPADQEICVDLDPCIPLNTQHIYSDSNDDGDDVLIWSDRWLNPTRSHRIVIRLTAPAPGGDTPLKLMTLGRVVYEIEDIYHDEPLKHIPPNGSILKNITIQDTGYQIGFRPHTACASQSWGGCSQVYAPWEKNIFEVEAGDPSVEGRRLVNETFMQALTAFPGADKVVPTAVFRFRGSALYLYGAPRSQIKHAHGAQEICVDGACHVVDTHELYLNIVPPSDQLALSQPSTSTSSTGIATGEHSVSPESTWSSDLEQRSVLLWHIDGLDWDRFHYVEYRLTEENPRWGPSDGGVLKGMTLDYVVYTSVQIPPPPPPPPPPSSPPASPPEQHPPLEDPPLVRRGHSVVFVVCFVVWTLKEILNWRRTHQTRPDASEAPPPYDGRVSERTPLRPSAGPPPRYAPPGCSPTIR